MLNVVCGGTVQFVFPVEYDMIFWWRLQLSSLVWVDPHELAGRFNILNESWMNALHNYHFQFHWYCDIRNSTVMIYSKSVCHAWSGCDVFALDVIMCKSKSIINQNYFSTQFIVPRCQSYLTTTNSIYTALLFPNIWTPLFSPPHN